MLAVFFGTDRTAARDAAKAYTNKAPVTAVDETTYIGGHIGSSVGAASLFGGTEIFLLDTPSSEDDFYAETLANLKEMAESANVFVIIEGALLADPKKKYGKYASVMEEFTADKAERFNSFAITEALAKKDKKQMWVLLQQARLAGLRDEEIVGMLWWQLKSLRLAKQTSTPEEAGMKDFPYKKSKQALKNFTDGEVEQLSRSLLELYHHAHQGKREMDLALEEWVLSI